MLDCVWQIKEPLGALGQYRRGKRTVRLAKFNFGVDDVLHRGITRISENAAVPQGARAPLEAALEPPNHLSLLQTLNHHVEEPIVIHNILIRDRIFIEKVPHFRRTIGFSPVSMVHAKTPRIPQQHVVGPQGGCLLYTSPSPRDGLLSRMPSSA